jgi:hypothetical protein
MLLAAGVVRFNLSRSSKAVRRPLGRESARRVKRTSVGIAAREDVRVKILGLGGRKVLIRKARPTTKRILSEIWVEDGRGRGGGV